MLEKELAQAVKLAQQANIKLRYLVDPKVVAITGSSGKTTNTRSALVRLATAFATMGGLSIYSRNGRRSARGASQHITGHRGSCS